jgi:predicted branched-subunit amino acid permease
MREVDICKSPLVAFMFLAFMQEVFPNRRRRRNRWRLCSEVNSNLYWPRMFKLGGKVSVQSEDEIAGVDAAFPLLLLPKLFEMLRAKMSEANGG